ncbi:hypothetical protein Tco_0523920 [Tanacetum coccineum]
MRKTRSVTISDSQYAVFNGTEYAVLIFLNEYAVLDRKLDTPYPMEVDTPYRFIDQNSGLKYGRYGHEYSVLPSSGYGVLDLVSFVVFGAPVAASTNSSYVAGGSGSSDAPKISPRNPNKDALLNFINTAMPFNW